MIFEFAWKEECLFTVSLSHISQIKLNQNWLIRDVAPKFSFFSHSFKLSQEKRCYDIWDELKEK
jgi:hypothetical protein